MALFLREITSITECRCYIICFLLLTVQTHPLKQPYIASQTQEESSEDIKRRVDQARTLQLKRYGGQGIYCNAQLDTRLTKRYCVLDTEGESVMKHAFAQMGLSARAYGRILKVARTIADLEGSESIQVQHVAEAVQYRSLDRKYWGA